jgi:hypothetical protein
VLELDEPAELTEPLRVLVAPKSGEHPREVTSQDVDRAPTRSLVDLQMRSVLLATFASANRLHNIESRPQPHDKARTMAGRGQRG